jgi:uncharacterized membrane protein YeaQ/YmgE (transglycosylase-associated protein family)
MRLLRACSGTMSPFVRVKCACSAIPTGYPSASGFKNAPRVFWVQLMSSMSMHALIPCDAELTRTRLFLFMTRIPLSKTRIRLHPRGNVCVRRRERMEHIMEPVSHGIIFWLIFGGISGALGGRLVDGGGFGVIVDIIVGVVGAFTGGWLGGALDLHQGSDMVGSLLTASIDVVIVRPFTRAGPGEPYKASRLQHGTRCHIARRPRRG